MAFIITVSNEKDFFKELHAFGNKHTLIDNNENWLTEYKSPYSLGYVEEGTPIDILLTYTGRGASTRWYYQWRPSPSGRVN